MPRKSSKSSEVKIVTDINQVNPVEQENDNNIQADKKCEKVVTEVIVQEIEKKPRRKMNEKQLENLKKGREISLSNKAEKDRIINEEKAEMKRRLDELEIELKKQKDLEFENKLIKKAVALKKKQIERDKLLEKLEKDNETKEVVKNVIDKQPKPSEPSKQQNQQIHQQPQHRQVKYNFV